MYQQNPPPGGFPPQQFQQQPNGYGQQQPQQGYAQPPPQQGFQQPQSVPQQGFQQPGQPAMPGAYGAPPMGPQGAPQTAPQPVGLPEIYLPDEQVVAQAYQKAEEEAKRIQAIREGRFPGGMRFLKLVNQAGVSDSRKWAIGDEARFTLWVCPAYQPGMMPGVERRTIFWKSQRSPQGDKIDAHPIIEASRKLLFKSGLEKDAEHAKNNGKVKRSWLYNVIWLDNYQGHFDEDGKMTPFVYDAGWKVHKAIEDMIHEHGASVVCHPNHGRPVTLRKRKTGGGDMDIEYSCQLALQPQPLDPAWYPVLHNLHDLSKLEKEPTADQIYTALVEMRLPLTPDIQAMLQQKQQEEASTAAQQPQQGTPQQFQNGQPPQQPPQQGFQNQPSYQHGHAPPQQNPYPPQNQYAVQPDQQYNQGYGDVVHQAMHAPQPQVQQQPIQLVRGQIQVALDGGRERCFGNNNPSLQLCQTCPDWIKQQCIPQSATGQPTQPQGFGQPQQLTQLQNKLNGN